MVITRGEDGPIAFTKKYPEGISQPAHRVEVADTVGAGDSLMAALIAACSTAVSSVLRRVPRSLH